MIRKVCILIRSLFGINFLNSVCYYVFIKILYLNIELNYVTISCSVILQQTQRKNSGGVKQVHILLSHAESHYRTLAMQ